jgi:hypothetical protein
VVSWANHSWNIRPDAGLSKPERNCERAPGKTTLFCKGTRKEPAQVAACFCCFLVWLTLQHRRWGDMFFQNVGLSPNCIALQSEGRILHSHCCEVLKVKNIDVYWKELPWVLYGWKTDFFLIGQKKKLMMYEIRIIQWVTGWRTLHCILEASSRLGERWSYGCSFG